MIPAKIPVAPSRPPRSGMTLVELLIALGISSALLVALAAAFHASTRAVEFNDSYFRCTQTARLALDQLVTEIRCADAVEVASGGATLRVIRPAGQLAPKEIYRQFSFNREARRITLEIFYAGNSSSPVYELAANVTDCTFGVPRARSDAGSAQTAGSIPVRITCSIGSASATLAGAATPRRMMSAAE
jgi:prepilin-type N-terminal cleavage/methylation domain-containing protein